MNISLIFKIVLFTIIIIITIQSIKSYIRLKDILKIGIIDLGIIFICIAALLSSMILDISSFLIFILPIYHFKLLTLQIEINSTFSKNNKTFLYFHQRDKRWNKIKYGRKSTIGSTGCGATVLAMIHSIVDPAITPEKSVKWIDENYKTDRGTSLETMIKYLNNIGLESTYLQRNCDLISALKEDNVICVLVRNSLAALEKLFGNSENHIILLYDITQDNCRIADPANYSKSIKPMKLKKLYKSVSKLQKGVNAPYIAIKF